MPAWSADPTMAVDDGSGCTSTSRVGALDLVRSTCSRSLMRWIIVKFSM